MPALVDWQTISERDYLAPTVYRKKGVAITQYNYYKSASDAIKKYWYLQGKTTTNPTPVGQVKFTSSTDAQTMGINVDFYALTGDKWQLTSYKYLRSALTTPPIVFRFYTTDGNGPYYAIYDAKNMGMSATAISAVPADKLAALDAFQRETRLMQYRYNSLAGFLNTLAKKQLNAKEQQIFNEGILKLQSMQAQMSSIKGIEISFTDKGAVVGFIPILIIAAIAILAAATAWTIVTINEQKEATKRINDSYELNKWIAAKKQEIAAAATAGTITQQQATEINKTLDGAAAAANTIAENASEQSAGFFGSATSFLKWGLLGYIVYNVVEGNKPRHKRLYF